jgi:predicted permease
VLVVAEVALSLVLLVSAGLMIRSFLGMLRIEPGFNPENLLTKEVVLPRARYAGPPQIIAFNQQLFERIRALPGVAAVGAGSGVPPVFNQMRGSFAVEGYQPSNASETMSANQLPINSEYFKALGAPLVQGREFDDRDAAGAPKVVIISQSMARRFFPDGNVLGKRIDIGDTPQPDWRAVVGVAPDLKYSGSLYSEDEDAIYLPYLQSPPWGMYLFVRTNSEPSAMTPEVRNVVRAIDRDVPVAKIRTMRQVLAESVAQPRFYTLLLGIFAAIALIMATIGLYGVISYAVAQRTHELGVRVALGAGTGDIIKLVVTHGLRLSIIGSAIGLFLAFGVTRVFASLLYGVSPVDPLTLIATPLLLIGVTLLACFIPARRATRVDPVTALRQS